MKQMNMFDYANLQLHHFNLRDSLFFSFGALLLSPSV